jgi:hypothetical protein
MMKLLMNILNYIKQRFNKILVKEMLNYFDN